MSYGNLTLGFSATYEEASGARHTITHMGKEATKGCSKVKLTLEKGEYDDFHTDPQRTGYISYRDTNSAYVHTLDT